LKGASSGTSIEGCDVRDVVDGRLLSVCVDVLRDGAAVEVRVERVAVDSRAGIVPLYFSPKLARGYYGLTRRKSLLFYTPLLKFHAIEGTRDVFAKHTG